MRALSRREFIEAVAASCCMGAAGRRRRSAVVVDALAAVVLDAAAAARLGRRFLADRPGLANDPVSLGRMILPTSAQRRVFVASGPAARRRILQRRIAADFTARRTLDVDGWVLAETETLLAALVAVR